MSVPATNARSPAPVKTTQRISGSSLISPHRTKSRSYISSVIEFRASGRLNVTHITGPRRATRILSCIGSCLRRGRRRAGSVYARDDACSLERGDLIVAESIIAQDVVLMLAQHRTGDASLGLRRRKAQG